MKLDKQSSPHRQFRLIDEQTVAINDTSYQLPILIEKTTISSLPRELLDSPEELAEKISPATLLLIGSNTQSHQELIQKIKWPLEKFKIGTEIMPMVSAFQTYTILDEEERTFKMILL